MRLVDHELYVADEMPAFRANILCVCLCLGSGMDFGILMNIFIAMVRFARRCRTMCTIRPASLRQRTPAVFNGNSPPTSANSLVPTHFCCRHWQDLIKKCKHYFRLVWLDNYQSAPDYNPDRIVTSLSHCSSASNILSSHFAP